MPNKKDEGERKSKTEGTPQAPNCGIVMPISATDGCTAEHWLEVQSIIKEAIASIADPTFTAGLVSDSDEIGVIHKRIVQSLYNSDIVVCDVSGKNPNVMFELGLRLAFDKPTVIVKDDKTDYSFDTGIIEHIPYPRDLRFAKVVHFKARLAEKIARTYEAAQTDPEHSPFLKNFGEFKVVRLDQTEVSIDRAIIELLYDLKKDVTSIPERLRGGIGSAAERQIRILARQKARPYIQLAVEALIAEGHPLKVGDVASRMQVGERIPLVAPTALKVLSALRLQEFEAEVDDVLLELGAPVSYETATGNSPGIGAI